jgi:hypothetical protein
MNLLPFTKDFRFWGALNENPIICCFIRIPDLVVVKGERCIHTQEQ